MQESSNQDTSYSMHFGKNLTMKPCQVITLMQLLCYFMLHKGGQTVALEPHPVHKIFNCILLAHMGISGPSKSPAVGGRETVMANTI